MNSRNDESKDEQSKLSYYERNRDRILERNSDPVRREADRLKAQKYRRESAEKCRAARAAYVLDNPEAIKKAVRKQYEKLRADPLRLLAKQVRDARRARDGAAKNLPVREAYRAANSAKVVASVAAWRIKNPEAVARHANNRRARKIEAGGVLSRGLSDRLFILQKGLCACCGAKLGKRFHLDHIIPLAKGGTNDDSNIQLLTPKCNSQKSHKDPIDFMRARGFLI